MQCQLCDKPACVHLTEIVDGKKIEQHLCEECAQTEGVTIKTQVPLSELLNNLVDAQHEARELTQISCPQCKLTWPEFRKTGLLGCPNDYPAFEKALGRLIEQAQEGATEHVGRAPHNVSGTLSEQVKLLRLRQELQQALDDEDYEAAAAIRDKIEDLTSN